MDHETDDAHDPERDEDADRVRSALMTALGVVVVIGVLIALGTVIVVRALGLDESESAESSAEVPSGPARTLPTTALPVPGEEPATSDASEDSSEEPSDPKPTKAPKGDLQLNVMPVQASPMERINLTGRYRGADNLGLQVQRFEGGQWRDFGVQATVRVGTYETYVMTGRPGEQRFRVWDPAAKKGSNVVLVTIG